MPQLAEQAEAAPARLFAAVKDSVMTTLGIDAQVLPIARVLTAIEQLDALRGMLPHPQYDVLVGLASGMTPEEVWADIAASAAPGGRLRSRRPGGRGRTLPGSSGARQRTR